MRNRARGMEVYLDDFLLTDIQHWQPRVYVRISKSWPADSHRGPHE